MAGGCTVLSDSSRRTAPLLVASLCLHLPLLTAAVGRTKYVVHYMPWFLGPDDGHWCNADWGNSYYDSVFGRYDCREPYIHQRQLGLMKAAGIDGLWFDFQTPMQIPRIQILAEEALRIGLHFAIVADNYMDENVTNSMQEAIAAWMAMPNYYFVQGRPMLPLFEAPSRWQGRNTILPQWLYNGTHPFIVGTYHWHQQESVPLPSGYDSLFFWISSDIVWAARYHQSTRFSVKVGSVYRGWREAYRTYNHTPPYLGLLNSTLQIIEDNQPDFAQIVTWNDYTEGTMIEPSFLKKPGGCLDPRNTYWVRNETCNNRRRPYPPCTPALWAPCAGSGEQMCWDIEDCSKPYGVVDGAGAAGCPSSTTPAGGNLSAYYDLAMIARVARGITINEAIAEFRSIVEIEPPTTTTTTTTSRTSTTTTYSAWKMFEPEADGVDYACRGSSSTDTSSAYYSLAFGMSRLIECQALCLQDPQCTGVEHNEAQGRCEAWTVPIGVKVARSGFTCVLRRPPEPTVAATTTVSTSTSATTRTTSSTVSTSTPAAPPATSATAAAASAPATAAASATTTAVTVVQTTAFSSTTASTDAATTSLTTTTTTLTAAPLGTSTTSTATAIAAMTAAATTGTAEVAATAFTTTTAAEPSSSTTGGGPTLGSSLTGSTASGPATTTVPTMQSTPATSPADGLDEPDLQRVSTSTSPVRPSGSISTSPATTTATSQAPRPAVTTTSALPVGGHDTNWRPPTPAPSTGPPRATPSAVWPPFKDAVVTTARATTTMSLAPRSTSLPAPQHVAMDKPVNSPAPQPPPSDNDMAAASVANTSWRTARWWRSFGLVIHLLLASAAIVPDPNGPL